MAQPHPTLGYGETESLDLDLSGIKASLSELLPKLSLQETNQPDPDQGAMEPIPLADARLKAVKTQLARFPGQEFPEDEIV